MLDTDGPDLLMRKFFYGLLNGQENLLVSKCMVGFLGNLCNRVI
jgi:hypothetical protein